MTRKSSDNLTNLYVMPSVLTAARGELAPIPNEIDAAVDHRGEQLTSLNPEFKPLTTSSESSQGLTEAALDYS
jgi:hypothetical protein